MAVRRLSQFRAAEMIAAKWNITRRQMEEFALESNRRAIEAIERGFFTREIAPINGLEQDETPRAGYYAREDGDARAAHRRRPYHRGRVQPDRRCRRGAADRLGGRGEALQTQAPARAFTTSRFRGADPIWMLTAPIPATQYALSRSGPQARRNRSGRDQRSLRLGGARLATRPQRRSHARSTSTVARSPSGTRWGRPAPDS